ncbi:MAG: hypothetical protein PVH19_02350 [Planctomycetia bacterium]|jgi:hypothetical protein
MRIRRVVCLVVMGVLVLGFATPVFANSMAAWGFLLPGLVFLTPINGLLLSILVGVIERPFVSLAGVDKRPCRPVV